jgi:8-oxo-dGTP diphosphatase
MVPVGTAVLLLSFREIDGKLKVFVLLGKRKGSHGAGEWSFPGGRLEPREDPRCRASLELEEETGIIIPGSDLGVFRAPYTSASAGGEHWVTLFFYAVVRPFTRATVREPDKCETWEWFSWDCLPSPLFGAIGALVKSLSVADLISAYASAAVT